MKPLFNWANFQPTKDNWNSPNNFGMHCDNREKQNAFLRAWNKATGANKWKSGDKFIDGGKIIRSTNYRDCIIWTSGQYGDCVYHQGDKDRIFEFDDYHWEELDGPRKKPAISTASLF